MNFRQLTGEIHRRGIWQVAVIHLTVTWIGFQVARALTAGLELPTWFPGFTLGLLLLGLPVTLATACIEEGLPLGPRARDPKPERGPVSSGRCGRESPARRLFNWRNAILGGVLAFILWVITASGWLLLAERLVDTARNPAVQEAPLQEED